ncbi:CSPP1 protein, partial [Centropus unirufus]|nr:CSPP1 protein [Centropus unirufus]
SVFPGANGEMFPALGEVNLCPQLPPSARERRRLKQKALERAEDVPPSRTPLLQPDSFSLHSNFSLDVERLKGKNEERLRRLTELQQHPAHSGDRLSLGAADDLTTRTSSPASRRPSSGASVATEPWLRPGTSEPLHRFTAESSPAKLSPDSPLGWQGLSTAHG